VSQSIIEILDEALADEATVTVVLDDDRAYTGTVAQHPTDPAAYVVKTGRRGRPPVIHPDEVALVISEQ
jgi:hypothetical protein